MEDAFASAFAAANGLTLETENSSLNNSGSGTPPAGNPPAGNQPANSGNPPTGNPPTPPTPPANPNNPPASGNPAPGAGDGNPPAQPQSFEKLLETTSKGRFKSLEDIDNYINSELKKVFVSEKVEKLNQYMKSGGKFEDFARTQLTDYTKLDEKSKIRERLRITDSYLTDEEIDVLIDTEYSVPETATDRDKQLINIKLKKDAKEAENVLLEHQKKWAVADRSPEELQAEAEAEFAKWQDAFHSSVDAVGKIELNIGEKDLFSYEIPAEVKKSVKDNYTQLNNFWNRYNDKEGKEDIPKLARDLFILENLDKIILSATAFAKSKGREEVIAEMKNPGYQAPPAGGNQPPVESIEDQIAKNSPI